MKSTRDIYKIGVGPSSSHTMGPVYATERFLKENKTADFIAVTLYGSLAETGKGHGTDRAIISAIKPKECEIIFDYETVDLPHPNTLDFTAYKGGEVIGKMRALSVGGGDIEIVGDKKENIAPEVYKENSFTEIAEICKAKNIRLSDYVFKHEGKDFKKFLLKVWHVMTNAISEGLTRTGILPGGLEVQRKAQKLHSQRHIDESAQTKENRLVCSYAFAVSDQNADLGTIVTAPTCGACGVVPAVLKYMQDINGFTDDDIV